MHSEADAAVPPWLFMVPLNDNELFVFEPRRTNKWQLEKWPAGAKNSNQFAMCVPRKKPFCAFS